MGHNVRMYKNRKLAGFTQGCYGVLGIPWGTLASTGLPLLTTFVRAALYKGSVPITTSQLAVQQLC